MPKCLQKNKTTKNIKRCWRLLSKFNPNHHGSFCCHPILCSVRDISPIETPYARVKVKKWQMLTYRNRLHTNIFRDCFLYHCTVHTVYQCCNYLLFSFQLIQSIYWSFVFYICQKPADSLLLHLRIKLVKRSPFRLAIDMDRPKYTETGDVAQTGIIYIVFMIPKVEEKQY